MVSQIHRIECVWKTPFRKPSHIYYCMCTHLSYSVFPRNVPYGGWSTVGLHVENLTNMAIKCSSTYLTSFAVLVDVSGATQVILVSIFKRMLLTIICYVGYLYGTKKSIVCY